MAHHERPHEAPPANKGLLWAAGAILSIPVIAIMWVGSYSRVEPRLGSFPFFIWYQMLWVILTAICTSIAYRLVLKARPHRPMRGAQGADPREHAPTDGTNPASADLRRADGDVIGAERSDRLGSHGQAPTTVTDEEVQR